MSCNWISIRYSGGLKFYKTSCGETLNVVFSHNKKRSIVKYCPVCGKEIKYT